MSAHYSHGVVALDCDNENCDGEAVAYASNRRELHRVALNELGWSFVTIGNESGYLCTSCTVMHALAHPPKRAARKGSR